MAILSSLEEEAFCPKIRQGMPKAGGAIALKWLVSLSLLNGM